jgi:hypothetical protein
MNLEVVIQTSKIDPMKLGLLTFILLGLEENASHSIKHCGLKEPATLSLFLFCSYQTNGWFGIPKVSLDCMWQLVKKSGSNNDMKFMKVFWIRVYDLKCANQVTEDQDDGMHTW